MQSLVFKESTFSDSSKLFRSLFAHSSDAIAVLSQKDHSVLAVNNALLSLSGFSTELYQRGGIEILFPGEENNRGLDFSSELLSETGLRDNVRIRRVDDHFVYVSMSVIFLPDEDNLAFACIFRDTTAKRLLEREVNAKHRALREVLEELAENNEELAAKNERLRKFSRRASEMSRQAAVGAMTAGFAHSINNPLGVIESSMRLIRKELKKCEALQTTRIESLLERQGNCVRRISEVIERIRVVARQGAPQNLTRERFSPTDGVRRALSMLEHRFGSELSLTVELEEVPVIDGYPDEFIEAVSNLIDNALNALEAQGCVVIRLYLEGEHTVLSIEDDGSGVAEALREQLFEPFVTGRDSGTGLGLYVCRDVAHRHGGEISYEEAEIGGARFLIRIPPQDTESKSEISLTKEETRVETRYSHR